MLLFGYGVGYTIGRLVMAVIGSMSVLLPFEAAYVWGMQFMNGLGETLCTE